MRVERRAGEGGEVLVGGASSVPEAAYKKLRRHNMVYRRRGRVI